MNSKEVNSLRQKCCDLKLENYQLLAKYSNSELKQICNGIGPDAFPEWLRDAISALHTSLAVVALIHDVEWHESDQSQEKFDESNARFKQNGYTAAKAEYAWYDPRRYIVMNQARRFGNICQKFGWKAWTSPCECAVCEKKRGMEKKENA